jgi:hypothetical protein
MGKGNQFNISIPTNKDVVVEGMKYNPTFKSIEVWGYVKPDKNIDPQYKNDLIHPESPFSTCGRPSNGGADGTPQPHKPKEYLT